MKRKEYVSVEIVYISMTLLSRLLKAFKPEQRALTSSDPIGANIPLARLAYGGDMQVMGIPAALCATRVISEAFSSCPAEIVETSKSGERHIVQDHPLAYRLNVEANDDISALDWRQASMHHLLLWGNCFSEMRYIGKEDFDFWLLLPQYTQVQRNSVSNALAYRTVLYPSFQTVELQRDECFHVKNLSYDGLIGLAPVMVNRMAFELANDQEAYASHYFKNNANPGGYYEIATRLSQQAKDNIIESHKKQFSGSRNANSVGILDEGMKFTQVTVPSEDGQYLASRTFQLSEISRIFNLSPVFIHDLSNPWADLETLNTVFVQRTLIPWIQRFEVELKRKVLGRHSNLSVHFNVQGLLRGDIATRFLVYSQGLQNGIYNINEVRHKEGMSEIGAEGDVYRVQLNMAAGQPGKQEPSNPDLDEVKDDVEGKDVKDE